MTKYSLGRIALALAGAVTMSGAKSAPESGRNPGCDANSPHAASWLATAQSTFPKLEKARLARLGWQAAPKEVKLVTVTATCDRVVAAHNSFVAKDFAAYRLTDAAIVLANSSYLVDVPPGNGPVEHMVFVYDSAMKFKVVY